MSVPKTQTTPVDNTTEVARGTIYGALARLYEEPSEELYGGLETGGLFDELRELVAESDLDVEVPAVSTEDDHELLCARFNDIFVVGYPDPVIPRYESEHLDTPWDQINLDLTRLYDYFDVSVDQDEREHHDYLVIELEFAGYLSRLAATGETDAMRARADFLEKHLLPFLESIESAIESEHETGIYSEVVAFSARFARADLARLEETLEDYEE